MKDSCRPRKLEPGIDAMYSMPRVLNASTMKSEPLVAETRLAAPGGRPSVSAALCTAETPCGGFSGFGAWLCATAVSGVAMVVAAPARAAPLRKPRRPTPSALLRFDIVLSLGIVDLARSPQAAGAFNAQTKGRRNPTRSNCAAVKAAQP